MKGRKKSLFWKLVCTIGVWALLLTIIQGICNYFFVTRYAANKDKAQTDLIEKQTEKLIAEIKNFPKMDELQLKLLERSIDKLEREIIKLDSKSDEILKRLTITEKGNLIDAMRRETVTDVTPAMKIVGMPYYIDNININYGYSIENKGKYKIKMNHPKLYLATTEIINDNNIRNQLIIRKDYHIETDMEIGDISPGEIVSHKLIIKLINPENIPKTIYYKIIFTDSTDPSIIKIVKNINRKEIYEKKTYQFSGNIIKPD